MSNVQFELPEDVAMQRAQEARANTIINSMIKKNTLVHFIMNLSPNKL